MRLIDADKLDLYTMLRPYCSSDAACEISDVIDNTPTVNPYEWISVKDRLPENFETVLALCRDGGMFVGRHTSWKQWQIWTAMKSTKIVQRTVTHWMSLPAPPKEG